MALKHQESELGVRCLHADMILELDGYIHPSLSEKWEKFKTKLSIYLMPAEVEAASKNMSTAIQILRQKGLVRLGEYKNLRQIVGDIDDMTLPIIDNCTQQIAAIRANQDPTSPPGGQPLVHPVQEEGEPGQPDVIQPTGLQATPDQELLQVHEPEGAFDPPLYQAEVNHINLGDNYLPDAAEIDFQGDAHLGAPGADAGPRGHDQGVNGGEGMANLEGTLGEEVKQVDLNRQTILESFMDIYKDESIVRKRLNVRFEGEMGLDTGGLTKDAFSTFWDKAFKEYFKGENSLVPFMPVSRFAEAQTVYPILGRILSHGVALTGTFPIRLSRCMLFTMINSNVTEDEESILKDVLLFLTPNERMLTRRGLTDFDNLTEREVNTLMDMFTRYSLGVQPRKETFRQNVVNLGGKELCAKGMMFTTWMKSGIPREHLEIFWNRLTMEELNHIYRKLEPTPPKVIDLLVASEQYIREEENQAFYFLTDFISSLNPEDLAHFLLFVTGSDVLPLERSINVVFSRTEGLRMHPVAHTCGNTLELPVGYSSSQELRRDFMAILNDPESYSMNIL
ncbi:E3 ubiquitin-protein ligase TOM1-like isoform X2 [Pecten maximus]|uniref:E3 ubiquitin-protein ligase TOM1-like isoform X2 n=1 Tax=Pecten maximus TaxID=6579 RepID=UPI0014586B44|nr:E3 ubiquitin-protein ligase TOM1-like isoform X2 [Pecten maximus]